MANVKMNISQEILSWIFKQVEYCNGNKSTLDTLKKWISGEKTPTFNQIEKISTSANIPLGYFFLQTPPKENFPILEYRTVDSVNAENPSRNLIDVIDDMSDIQGWMRDHLIDEGSSKLQFIGTIQLSDTVEKNANVIKNALGLSQEWFREFRNARESYNFLRRKLEEVGVIVMMSGIVGQNTRRRLEINEFRAFTLLDEFAPLIFINSNDSENAKLFSLMHEAAHLWFGESDFYNDQYSRAAKVSELEIKCNAVAAEILVPKDIFVKEWFEAKGEDVERIKQLANTFNCGTTVIARKALEFRYIESNLYDQIAQEAVRYYNMQQENKVSPGGNYYNNVRSRFDNRFLVALDNSVRLGKTSYTEAYRLTNLNRKTFAKTIDKVRGIDA